MKIKQDPNFVYNHSVKYRKKIKKIMSTLNSICLSKDKTKQKPLEEGDRENAQCAKSQVMFLFFGYTECCLSQLSSLGHQFWLQQAKEDTFKLALFNEV